MKNDTNDDYLDELAMEIGEPLPNLNSPKESSPTDQSPKDDLDPNPYTSEVNYPEKQSINTKTTINPSQTAQILTDFTTSNSTDVTVMENDDTRRILNPETPRETAQIFINEQFRSLGIRSLQCVQSSDTFFYWKNNHYRQACDREIQARLANFLQTSWKIKPAKGIEPETLVHFNTSRMKENEILNALKNICSEGVLEDPGAGPSWIFNLDENIPDPSMVIPFKNKLLSINHFLNDGNPKNCLFPLTPKYFDLSQIPFNIEEHDHGRLKPIKLINFLLDVFDGDESAVTLLQQWIGYCLTTMTFAQKILLIIGPPRSGKGTIARVIQEMLSPANYTNPSANSLANDFPLEDWVNKRLAILGDARFGDKKQAVKEILLQISGGDRVNVRRKHTTTLGGMIIPAKIMVLSNEMPSLTDNSGALASRFLYLKMTKTRIGEKDPDLFERDLKPEIPLIFWWALDGLRDLMLKKKKDFVQADTGKDSALAMKRYQAPLKSFIEEKCNIRNELLIPTETLMNAYNLWCEEYGIVKMNPVYFGRNLREQAPSVFRQKKGASEIPHYMTISLKDRS